MGAEGVVATDDEQTTTDDLEIEYTDDSLDDADEWIRAWREEQALPKMHKLQDYADRVDQFATAPAVWVDNERWRLEQPYEQQRRVDWVYVVLGLIGEAGEYVAVPLGATESAIKEAGDVCWYAARLHNLLKEPFWIDEHVNRNEQYVAQMGRVAEIAKKAIRDKFGKLSKEKKQELLGLARWLVGHIMYDLGFRRGVCDQPGWFGEQAALVCARNITKLHDRKTRGVLQGEGDNR